jgi:hypothetical protein
MFAPRAFWSARRSAGLPAGLAPPTLTAIAISLLIRVKAFAIRFHRANIVALRVSNIRPMGPLIQQALFVSECRLEDNKAVQFPLG